MSYIVVHVIFDKIYASTQHFVSVSPIYLLIVQVENHAVNSSFFPFIVAEKDVCMEIRMLEREIDDLTETYDVHGGTGTREARNRAMDFLHEMGWLLHRSHLKSRLGHSDPNSELFSLKRYRWLMEFSMDHDWCAVVRKLLDILLDGTVGAAGENHPFLKPALFEMGLLHRAVRRNSRPMVELLLGYVPDKVADEVRLEYNSLLVGGDDSFLFRPDVVGPAGVTPLHVAAGRDGSENVLDAFTNDPGKVIFILFILASVFLPRKSEDLCLVPFFAGYPCLLLAL